MFGYLIIVDKMANPSPLYVHAEAKGSSFFRCLGQRLNDSGAHDIDVPNIVAAYKIYFSPSLLYLGPSPMELLRSTSCRATELWDTYTIPVYSLANLRHVKRSMKRT